MCLFMSLTKRNNNHITFYIISKHLAISKAFEYILGIKYNGSANEGGMNHVI